MKFKIPPIFALWLLIAVTLAIFVGLSFSKDINIGSHTLKKGKFPETLLAKEDYTDTLNDSLLLIDPDTLQVEKVVNGPDTTIHSVLLFGDSMAHYLAMSIAKYGSKNNYKVTSVSWVSSSISGWSHTDKIKKYMSEVNPDFIMVILGANDLSLKDYEKKIPEIKRIISQIDSVPYIWIGPPLWKKDKGLYPVLSKTIENRRLFKIDEDFEMPRARDHIHPTPKGADLWADTLMRWIRTNDLPLLTQKPDSATERKKHKFIYLEANE